MPIKWEKLDDILPSDFTMLNVLPRYLTNCLQNRSDANRDAGFVSQKKNNINLSSPIHFFTLQSSPSN
jgi:hypothetical protein